MYAEPQELLSDISTRAAGYWRMAYIPHEETDNAYTGRMRELLSGFGSVERFVGLKTLLRQLPRSWRCYDLIVVNWLDNAIVAADGRVAWGATCKLFLKTLLMRPFTKRLLFVRHNQYPHHTSPGSRHLVRRLIDIYESLFSLVMTHSGAALGAHRHYCPHPLYRPAPPATATLPELPLTDDYFIVFGRIAPYKKIEVLLEHWPPQCTLVVVGAIADKEYAERLAAIQQPNFIFKPGYIDEAVAQQLVRGARGMVIANADADVLVSGSSLYAFSFACPIYAIATPFLCWARERLGSDGNDLLMLAEDVPQLCHLINRSGHHQIPIASRVAVMREFDDTAVLYALTTILDE